MKKMYKITIIFTIILTLLFVILLYREQPKTISDQLRLWKISMAGAEEFLISDASKRAIGDREVIDATAQRFEQILKIRKIKDIDKQDAIAYIDDKRFLIDSLFTTTPSPYPDVITQTIVCPEKFQPVINEIEKEGQSSVYYILYANERFTYGVCSEDLIAYKAVFALVYCEDENDLYQIEFFVPVDEFDETKVDMIESFTC